VSAQPKLIFVSTGNGRCTIHIGTSVGSVKRAVLRSVGTMVGVKEAREATPKDIAWVRGMGGYVPNLKP
jgi:hypothetical protein